MDHSRTARYDLFKTVVAVILAAILILMLLRGCAADSAPAAAVVDTPPVDNTSAPAPTEELANVTEPPIPATPTPTLEPTPTAAALQPTSTPATESTPEPAGATPTSTAEAAAAGTQTGSDCNTSVPSRLSAGDTARVLQRLNMRSSPSIDAPILQTNATGTQVEIIDGPVCTPRGESAYQWWQLRLPNGAEGWSAESPLQEETYFLEPVP